MAGVIFSQLSGKNDILYGKFIAPIKAIITNEIERGEKESNLLNDLFNVEKSNRYAETIGSETGFRAFRPKIEGGIAENDEIMASYYKTIEHIEFGKEFTTTRKMVDDSQFGMCADMKAAPRNFAQAYNDTKLEVAALALANGNSTSYDYNGFALDLTTGDGQALFSKTHKSKTGGADQSNLYATAFSASNLAALSGVMRNFKDDNGRVLGYSADTIVLPTNRYSLENTVRVAIGSERSPGNDYNDINTQYGKWKIVINPFWEASADEFILMSSKANERLLGNMFFNRVDLDIINEVDRKTRNLVWNGYCRFGVGFGSWKHVLKGGVTGGTALA